MDGIAFCTLEAPDISELSSLWGVRCIKLPCSQANCSGIKGVGSPVWALPWLGPRVLTKKIPSENGEPRKTSAQQRQIS